MGIGIHPIRLGTDHCYVIKDKGVIMIDLGLRSVVKNWAKMAPFWGLGNVISAT